MERIAAWVKQIEDNGGSFRTAGGLVFGALCLLIFLITIFRVDAASINSAHVLILIVGLAAFLIPWVEKLSWTKDGEGSIEFRKDLNEAKTDINKAKEAIASLDRKVRELAATDPHKGKFGGKSSPSAVISAKVRRVSVDWYRVHVEIKAREGHSLPPGDVVFYLHPTFRNPVRRAPILNDSAVLEVGAWGSFTIGAELPNGERLEIDLAKDVPDVPEQFIK